MLEAVERVSPDLSPCLTCCAIDQPGSDTTAMVSGWLSAISLQVAACVEPSDVSAASVHRLFRSRSVACRSSARSRGWSRHCFSRAAFCCRMSISRRYASSSRSVGINLRGRDRARHVCAKASCSAVLSNKRGYTATFGRDLMDAGFDPREVMDKAELETVIVPSIARELRARFRCHLRTPDRDRPTPVGSDADARQDLDSQIDVMLWDIGRPAGAERTCAPGSGGISRRLERSTTWQELILDRIHRGPGLAVTAVGERLADARRRAGEISNLAARQSMRCAPDSERPGASNPEPRLSPRPRAEGRHRR